MQRRSVLNCAVAGLCAGLARAAMSQPRGEREPGREGAPRGPGMQGPGPRARPGPDGGPAGRRPERGPERGTGGRRPEPGEWHRGSHLPPEYRGHSYVVDDWRAHRLPRPPRGHHWVAVGGEYLLVAIPTGVIVQVVVP